MIPQKNGTLRPLIIASPRDKIVQEVMRIILESIFEPTFASTSHGFRPNKGHHTCLKDVRTNFSQSVWVIEGDFKACFDSINHKLLLDIIEKRIGDKRFIHLIAKALRAGYGPNRETIHANLIGTPQGSIISPILCNIFLTELDNYMAKCKREFDKENKENKENKLRRNPEYVRLSNRLSAKPSKNREGGKYIEFEFKFKFNNTKGVG